jgi:hypothetical protein
MTDYPDYEGEKSGVYSFELWAAKKGLGRGDWNSASVDDSTWTAVLTYTVPTGKELYVCGFGGNIEAENGLIGSLSVGIISFLAKAVSGGYMGFFSPLPVPILVGAGNTVRVNLYHKAGASKTCYAVLNGFLLDI